MTGTLVERKRAEIIGAALKVFSEKGYHAARIEDIATELGIGHGTFYRYFRNKLDIFQGVLDWILEKARELVHDVDPRSPDTLEEYRAQLEEIGDRMFALFKAYPEMSRILFYEAMGINDPDLQEKIRAAYNWIGKLTELYLINGKEKGYIRQDLRTWETALAINAALFEACRRVVSSEDPDREVAVWKEVIIELMLRGIAA
ncbi:MAG: TetR/AcrR family transcriptional regulator [Candidatus Geothermincolales bacterium]